MTDLEFHFTSHADLRVQSHQLYAEGFGPLSAVQQQIHACVGLYFSTFPVVLFVCRGSKGFPMPQGMKRGANSLAVTPLTLEFCIHCDTGEGGDSGRSCPAGLEAASLPLRISDNPRWGN